MKVLVYYSFTPERLELIRAAAPQAEIVAVENDEDAAREVVDAEVLLGHFPRSVFLQARKLRWIQSFSAGMDGFLYPEVVASDVVVTNAAGWYASHGAEHAFALLLALARGIPHFVENKRHHRWQGTGLWEISGLTLGIIGMGGFGLHTAKRAQGFDMRIIGIDPVRTEAPPGVEAIWPPERLHRLLAEADAVIIAAPRTPDTEGLIGEAELRLMKPTAFLVNVSRGGIIDEVALARALHEGWIAGAGLDVFDKEPLPPESPLWDCPNLIITAHAAGVSQHRPRRVAELFAANLRRYVNGEPLQNVIDKQRGF